MNEQQRYDEWHRRMVERINHDHGNVNVAMDWRINQMLKEAGIKPADYMTGEWARRSRVHGHD